jgi:hypothetical protein
MDTRRTTVMLWNLPEDFSRDHLISMLEEEGYGSVYDFVYVPMNFRTGTFFGYACVNFTSYDAALHAFEHFQNFCRWGQPTDKVCAVTWCERHQGLAAHVDRYRNSPLMHESIPDQYKPAVFLQGARVKFPAPTKKLRLPRNRWKLGTDEQGEPNLSTGM